MSLPKDIQINLEETIDEVRKHSLKSGKPTIFCVGTTMNIGNRDYFISSLREGENYVGSNIMVSSISGLRDIFALLDGKVDEILVDVEKKKEACVDLDVIAKEVVQASRLGFYRGNQAAASAFEHILISYCQKIGKKMLGLSACVIGAGHLGAKVVNILVELGAIVDVCDIDKQRASSVVSAARVMTAKYCQGSVSLLSLEDARDKKYSSIVGVTNGREVISKEFIDTLEPGGFIIDAGLGTVSSGAIEEAKKKNIPVFCLWALPGFNGVITTHCEAEKIVKEISRRHLKDGFSLVSGGIIGAYGDIIVDSAKNPRRVIGVARGNGLVLTDEEKDSFVERIEIVKSKYIKEKT